MSPELVINKKEKITIPDKSGVYDTTIGPITVDASKIAPGTNRQVLIISGDYLRGREGSKTESGIRTVELCRINGTRSTMLKDGVRLDVALKRPIQSYDLAHARRIGEYYPDYPEQSTGEEMHRDRRYKVTTVRESRRHSRHR